MTDKICGAKTKDGSMCQSIKLLKGKRCRIHGGLSTGPKTLKGRRKSALNIGKSYDALLADKLMRVFRRVAWGGGG